MENDEQDREVRTERSIKNMKDYNEQDEAG